jgi:DNA-binding response OmpR family regulator
MTAPREPVVPHVAWVGAEGAVPAALAAAGVVTRHADSDTFLLAPGALDAALYVVELAVPGVPAPELLKLLRRRRPGAGIVALSAQPDADFVAALDAGADLLLPLQPGAGQLEAALRALARRACGSAPLPPWRLLEAQRQLLAPNGAPVALSDAELVVMRCFADAPDRRVPRQQLIGELWGDDAGAMDSALQTMLYRLRRRIEQAAGGPAPIHAVSRVGYEFRAPLQRG